MKVTPWEVSGSVDYDRLVEEFGTKKIDGELLKRMEKHSKEMHLFLRRGFFFSHRDFDLVLEDCEKGKGFYLYTGRKPSGPMHIGHLIPMLFTKWLQDVFDVNLYIEITDDEKYVFDRETNWKQIDKWAEENMRDIAAVGFNPEKTFMFKDREYIRNTYPMVLAVARKVTFSTTKAVFGFNDQSNIGQVFYPAYQTVPAMFEKKRCLIPCAIDQDPYWRIQRDVAESLGYYKTAAIHSKFLPPLTGVEGKMSASIADTALWLDDDEKTVRKKVNRYAFSGGKETVEEHREKGGDVTVDVPFQWLSILFEPDDKRLGEVRDKYARGELLSGEMKGMLIDRINGFLEEHRKRREKVDLKKFTHTGKLAKEAWERTYEV